MDHSWFETSYAPEGGEDLGQARRYCRACHARQAFVPGKTPGRIPAGRWLPAVPRHCVPASPYVATTAARAAQRRQRAPARHRKSTRWWTSLRQLSHRARRAAIDAGGGGFYRWTPAQKRREVSDESSPDDSGPASSA